MTPNVNKIQKLVNEKFHGNKAAFANAIGVERSQVSHIINSGKGAGAQFFGGLFNYCENNNLVFRDYIFLPNDVKKIN